MVTPIAAATDVRGRFLFSLACRNLDRICSPPLEHIVLVNLRIHEFNVRVKLKINLVGEQSPPDFSYGVGGGTLLQTYKAIYTA